jgi:quercetin dioxygenase-like cupin family protein
MTELLRPDDSGGVLGLLENEVPAGWEGPEPDHEAADHGYYVIDGELAFQSGDDAPVRLGGGGFAFAPRGVRHAVANASDARARYMLVTTPAPAAESGHAGPALRPTVVDEMPGRVKVLLRGADSGGRVALMDNVVPAHTPGPPLHHHDFDEAFYLLEGEATFRLGDQLITRRAGELAWAPRGAHHTFANLSDADLRWLLICTPAGFERYFQRMAAKQAGVEPPPEALEPWPEVTVVGPRIGQEA